MIAHNYSGCFGYGHISYIDLQKPGSLFVPSSRGLPSLTVSSSPTLQLAATMLLSEDKLSGTIDGEEMEPFPASMIPTACGKKAVGREEIFYHRNNPHHSGKSRNQEPAKTTQFPADMTGMFFFFNSFPRIKLPLHKAHLAGVPTATRLSEVREGRGLLPILPH